jgi:hypothetical protein
MTFLLITQQITLRSKAAQSEPELLIFVSFLSHPPSHASLQPLIPESSPVTSIQVHATRTFELGFNKSLPYSGI